MLAGYQPLHVVALTTSIHSCQFIQVTLEQPLRPSHCPQIATTMEYFTTYHLLNE